MKKIKLTLIFVFIFGLMATRGAYADGKMGYVDLARLFDEYYKTKTYDQSLEAKYKDFEKERNERVEKFKEAQGKLGLLKDDAKANLQKDIEKMQSDLVAFDKQKKEELTKERNEKIREVLLEIEKIVSNYAKKNAYTVILNDRVLIYGDPSMDLTAQILKELNTGAPASVAAPADKK